MLDEKRRELFKEADQQDPRDIHLWGERNDGAIVCLIHRDEFKRPPKPVALLGSTLDKWAV